MNTIERATEPASDSGRWRVSAWVHLVYLVIPFFQPLFQPDVDWLDWLVPAAAVAAFLPVYAIGVLRPDRARLCFGLTTALGVVAIPLNTGTAVLFVYAAAFAGVAESPRLARRLLVVLTVLLGLLTVVSVVPLPWRFWGVLPSLLFLWVIGLVQIEDTERLGHAAELRLRNARIEHLATVSERERLASELHDLLGHSLTAMVMRAQLVQRLTTADPDRAGTEAAEIERTAREALTQVRGTLAGWRQASLDGEVEAARTTLASMSVDLVDRRESELVLVGSTEHALALALREAVTNVARHANARTCRVGLDAADGELRLTIADDGIGGHARDGQGLTGMRERISALGGNVLRTGRAGTTVTISVPLEVAT